MWLKLLVLCFGTTIINSIDLKDLPPDHIPYIFNAFPKLAKVCEQNPECPYKAVVGKDVCWGYELGCNVSKSYHVRPQCPGDHRGWVKTKEAQYETFYTQADFGKLLWCPQRLVVANFASFLTLVHPISITLVCYGKVPKLVNKALSARRYLCIVVLDSLTHRPVMITLFLLILFSGYVKEQIEDSMVMCEASFQGDSSLECSKYLRYTYYNEIFNLIEHLVASY